MNRFWRGDPRPILCGIALLTHGCNFSGGWKTERYRDDASGAQVVIAKQRFKRDKVEISAAARCVLPGTLTLEFTASDSFRVAGTGSARTIPYAIGLNGNAPVRLSAPFGASDTLIVPRRPGKDSRGEPIDLASAQDILLRFQLATGATGVDFHSSDPGIADAFKACGFDPAAMALRVTQQPNESTEIHRPAPPLNGRPVVKPVTLATLSGPWQCSGDLGDFTFSIDSYRYAFSDDSPWSTVTGRVAVGASQESVDGSASFPITFEDSPWTGEGNTPWSYSSLGAGTIYYISTRTGQSAQCVRAS